MLSGINLLIIIIVVLLLVNAYLIVAYKLQADDYKEIQKHRIMEIKESLSLTTAMMHKIEEIRGESKLSAANIDTKLTELSQLFKSHHDHLLLEIRTEFRDYYRVAKKD